MRGQVLIAAILVLLVVTASAMTIAIVAETEHRRAVRDVRRSAVFYAANSGLEYAAAMLSINGKRYTGGTMPVFMDSLKPGDKDIEIIIDRPAVILENSLATIYAVRSVARCGPIHISIEADVTIQANLSSHIGNFRERKVL